MARRGRLGPWYLLGIALVKPFSAALWRRESSGREHPPATGGTTLAVDHISLAGQWGLQEVRDSYRGEGIHPFPRHTARFRLRRPVDLSRPAGRPLTAEVLRDATGTVMAALPAEVEALRGQPAPSERRDLSAAPPADGGRRTA